MERKKYINSEVVEYDDIYDATDDLDNMDIEMEDNECSPEEYVENHREEVIEYMKNIGNGTKKSKIDPNDTKVTIGEFSLS